MRARSWKLFFPAALATSSAPDWAGAEPAEAPSAAVVTIVASTIMSFLRSLTASFLPSTIKVVPAGTVRSFTPSASESVSYQLMESTGPVYDVLYTFGQDSAAKSGAYGLNVHASRTSWYLEYQRAGGYDIIAGCWPGETQH